MSTTLLVLAMSAVASGEPAKTGDTAPAAAGGTQPLCMIVLVYDDTCKTACVQVRGVVHELTEKYAGKVKYVELNVAAPAFKESVKTAKEAGKVVYSFISA